MSSSQLKVTKSDPRESGRLAADLGDESLAAMFPAVIVIERQDSVVDANAAGSSMLEVAPGERWIGRLLASAPKSPAARGAGAVAVHCHEPDVEGLAWEVEDSAGRRLVVAQLRWAAASPFARGAEGQLRLYEAVLATGPIFVHVYDRDTNSVWSTASLRPEIGHSPAQPLSSAENYALVHPDDRAAMKADHERMLAGEPRTQRRVRVRDADGGWRWLSIISVNLLDDPAVGSVVVHSWDVTEEVAHELELDDASQRLAALIDTLDEGVVVVSEGRITFANARISELFPTAGPHDALIGREPRAVESVFAGSVADPGALAETTLRVVSAGEPVRGLRVEMADGRVLEQDFIPIHVGGRETSRVWVSRDITAREQLERRRERLLEMERRARQTAERQNEQLRQLDELKNGFVAATSHELRTPLSALTSYLELLLDESGDPLSDEQRMIAESAQRGAARLARLVDDLLVLARLEARALHVDRAPVDVATAVSEAAEDVRRGAERDVRLELEIEAGSDIFSDRLRVMQIVSNLLGNAVKFASTSVHCSARPDRRGWVVEIVDDGPGIPAEEGRRVFEPFVRGRQAIAGEKPGVGLGLAICSQLTALLGGTLTLESQPEGGTLARLTLPFSEPAGEEASDER